MAKMRGGHLTTIDQDLLEEVKLQREFPAYMRPVAIVSWIWAGIFALLSWNLRDNAAEAVGIYELNEVGGIIYESWLIQTVVFFSSLTMILTTTLLFWFGEKGIIPFLISVLAFMSMPFYSYFLSPVQAMKTLLELALYTLVPLILFASVFVYLLRTWVRRN